MRLVAAGATIAALLGVARPAQADRIFTVDFQAPDTCPDRARFVERIESRSRVLRFASPFDLAPDYVVRVTLDPRGRQGRLVIRSVDGHELTREVPGQSCIEIVDGMALVAAVTMDPDLARAEARTPETAPQPCGVASTKTSDSRPAPCARVVPRPIQAAHFRVGAGVGIGLSQGLAPDPAIGAGVFVEVSRSHPTAWAPAVRVSLHRFESPLVDTPIGQAELTLTGGRISGCPVRLPARSAWGLRPCLSLEAGRLEGVGLGVISARRETGLWIAAAPIARLELNLLRMLWIEAEGGPLFPIIRHRFVFKPDTTVHEVPALGWNVGLSLGTRLP
jgi:hypothetical protein